MTFSALHRALGLSPEPFSDAMLDAVDAQVKEASDLDWKSALPPAKGLSETDFPKDVAAMANSGEGIIVFGVREVQKAASERVDVGELSESHERALRSVAITAISPPVFGLKIHQLGPAGSRAVVVEVPPSVDGPHLIYRHDYFGAPLRNDADTVWMKERQIEAMYLARFDERRHASDTLDRLFTEAATGRDSTNRAWLIAVAHPTMPQHRSPLTRDEVRSILSATVGLALLHADRDGNHPLESVDRSNPRPGLRRWVAVNEATDERSRWKDSWISSSAYDAVCAEAEAVMQAMAVQCAELGVSVTPTNALRTTILDSLFPVEHYDEAYPMFMVAMGYPDPDDDADYSPEILEGLLRA